MTDSKMPERIWAGDYGDTDGGGYWWLDPDANTGLAEYIRADLAHPAPVADAELEALATELDEAWNRGTDFEKDYLENVRTDLFARVSTALRARTAEPVGGA